MKILFILLSAFLLFGCEKTNCKNTVSDYNESVNNKTPTLAQMSVINECIKSAIGDSNYTTNGKNDIIKQCKNITLGLE